MIHALHLLDDILLMDNTSSYRMALKERALHRDLRTSEPRGIHSIVVHSFRKVQSDGERREVARALEELQR